MTEPLTASPSNANTLARPLRRLRLGTDEDDPGGERQWQLWVPSFGGAHLKITHDGGAKLTLLDKGGEILEQGDGVHYAEVAPGKHGRYYLVTSEPAGKLRCNCRQTGWARLSADPKAEPLIPYNFYFYPFDSKPKDAQDPLIKALRLYASAGTTVETPDGVTTWENQSHSMPAGNDWSGFEGHCHMAAPASAYFELPPEWTSVSTFPGVKLDREQMKMLGMEFFGSYGGMRRVWWMSGWVIDPGKAFDSLGQNSVLSYVLPGEARTPQSMEAAIAKAFGAAIARKRVSEFLAAIGGESKFEVAVTTKLGTAAASFYQQLVQYMLLEGHPLCGNMRVVDIISADPRGVWNHALFHFGADFEETAGSDNELDLTVTCVVAGNVDDKPPFLDEYPAKVVNHIPVPSRNKGICARWQYQWRLRFNGSGWPLASDDNRWLSCRGVHGQAVTTELYPPADLNIPEKSAVLGGSRADMQKALADRHRLHPDVKDQGNGAVKNELVDRGYLTIHARYR
jgi:hypothetical protein